MEQQHPNCCRKKLTETKPAATRRLFKVEAPQHAELRLKNRPELQGFHLEDKIDITVYF